MWGNPNPSTMGNSRDPAMGNEMVLDTIRLEVREDYARDIKSDALFITRMGNRPTGESIRKIIKSKLRQLGIDEKGISVHALRHLFASAYNEASQNDLAGLKEITGHSNLSNLGIYTHPTLKRIQDNLEKMKINRNR